MTIYPIYTSDGYVDASGGVERSALPDGPNIWYTDLDLGRDGSIEVTVEAVAMYDLIPGEPFHAKGEGNGYVVTLGGVRIYLAGVTECTPEMQAIRDVDVARVITS